MGLLELLPFTLGELQSAGRAIASLEDLLWRGLYPPPMDRGIVPGIWLTDYFGTYVERDLRQLLNVRDLQTFRTFVRMCAARTSQVLRDAEIANVPFMASADGMQC